MSHILDWKKHYKPIYNYLTLDFCVLSFDGHQKNYSRFVRIVVYHFMNYSRSSLLKSSAECSRNQSPNLS